MTREAIQGALINVSLILGIPVLRSRDAEESARIMLYAGRQLCSVISGAVMRPGSRPTVTLGNAWNLTVVGRYNNTRIKNHDNLLPDGGPGSLNSDDTYSRFNPAIGLTYAPSRQFSAYLGYNEGSRAPSSIEIGCADPLNPCKLPNALAGDPPLKQVVAKTIEAGIRGVFIRDWQWNLVCFGRRTTTTSSSLPITRQGSATSRISARHAGKVSKQD